MGREDPECVSTRDALGHNTDTATYGYPLESQHRSHSSTELSHSSRSSQDTDNTNYSHDSSMNYSPTSKPGRSLPEASNYDNTMLEQGHIEGQSLFVVAEEWSLDKGSHRNVNLQSVSPRSSTHETASEVANDRKAPRSMSDKRTGAHSPEVMNCMVSRNVLAAVRDENSQDFGMNGRNCMLQWDQKQNTQQVRRNNSQGDRQLSGATRTMPHRTLTAPVIGSPSAVAINQGSAFGGQRSQSYCRYKEEEPAIEVRCGILLYLIFRC
jgi:hypothetical protein